MIPACDLHEPGDVLCHYPRPSVTSDEEVYQSPGLLAQVLDLKWEIAFYSMLIIGIVTYAKLGS